jgi:acetyl esterase/lipase
MNEFTRRRTIQTVLAAGAVLPFTGGETLRAQPIDDYIARYVHPDLRTAARQFAAMSQGMSLTVEALPQTRQGASLMARPRLPEIPVEKREVPGGRGHPPVTVYLINAAPGEARPAILHMHGGGYIIGSAADSIGEVQALCKTLGCAAVTVEYRLAPETTYVGSVEDNYAALKWLHGNAAALGVDPNRIAVMGESAGGGHAALLAIAARDRGEVPVVFQCLVYPMIDDRSGTSRQPPAHVGKLLWTPERNRFGWASFLGAEPGGSAVPVAGVPARLENFAGLPPAFIGVGSLDLFHDEDVDYAQRLNAAGVPAELIVVPGAFHGFDMVPTKISQWFTAAKLDALRRGLGISAA